MQICLVGLSHKTTPVAVRETVAVAPEEVPDLLLRLSRLEPLRECVVVSTCNRTELYGTASFYHDGVTALEETLVGLGARSGVEIAPHLYKLGGMDAVRHLFRVASSLDSLVVGEPQILGQVKEAYRSAADASTTALVLNRLFRQAISVGKRVRSATEIGALSVSVSSVAVELAERIFGSMEERAALVIGAGDTTRQTLHHLRDAGIGQVTVANRTRERAEELAREFGARAVELARLEEVLPSADMVIASATSPEPFLGRGSFEAALRLRRGRPMFVIDIAVPRNVDPAAGEVYNVFLYDMDDLERVVQSNLARRGREAERAEEIVEEEVRRFAGWWRGLESVPTLIQLRKKIDGIRAEELQRYLAKLEHLSERDRKLVEQLASSLVNKILHEPITRLKDSGSGERSASLAAGLRYLFRLDEESAGGAKPEAKPEQRAPSQPPGENDGARLRRRGR